MHQARCPSLQPQAITTYYDFQQCLKLLELFQIEQETALLLRMMMKKGGLDRIWFLLYFEFLRLNSSEPKLIFKSSTNSLYKSSSI